MDKLIMGLMLIAVGALSVLSVRYSNPITKSQSVEVQTPAPSVHSDVSAEPTATELTAAAEINHGAMGHGTIDHSAHMAGTGDTESTVAFKAANETMHNGMAITFSGDADVDFVKGMIPHHQGAIDMARVILAHGKDAELRKLAEGIVAAQESEIKMMRAWLAKNGK